MGHLSYLMEMRRLGGGGSFEPPDGNEEIGGGGGGRAKSLPWSISAISNKIVIKLDSIMGSIILRGKNFFKYSTKLDDIIPIV